MIIIQALDVAYILAIEFTKKLRKIVTKYLDVSVKIVLPLGIKTYMPENMKKWRIKINFCSLKETDSI